jgi:hypothetical protein
MAKKSDKDLVEKQAAERDLASREVDGGTPELAHHSDAISAGIFNPEQDQAPKSVTGDATPQKKG